MLHSKAKMNLIQFSILYTYSILKLSGPTDFFCWLTLRCEYVYNPGYAPKNYVSFQLSDFHIQHT